MAKIPRISKNKPHKKINDGILNRINLGESYTSLILGGIVVVIIGLLFISSAKSNRSKQISFIDDVSKINEQLSQDAKTSSTYTIEPGDDLWTISEKVYKDGFRWNEIAKVNKLEDPGLIYAGRKLVIPAAALIVSEEKQTSAPEAQATIAKNNSITDNTYTIKSGDNLWDIAVRAYGDGFKWPEIAKANNLENPSLIFPDNVLKIPR